jgi:hypothetical protein
MSNKILIIFLSAYASLSLAQVISVEPIEKGLFSASAPTKTFLWESKIAKATLIFIPGGEGQLNLNPDKKDLGGFYGNTLKPLSDPSRTSGIFNVVVFDSPVALQTGSSYPGSRATSSHLTRIESVVLYYKEKFNQPVWLMGHSNGAVSITEFYKYLQKNKKENLVSGIIYSSGRNGASFNNGTNLPVLFLAHQKDGCSKSTLHNSKSVYDELKKTDQQKVEYVLIQGGEAQSSDVCSSGHHMFYGAGEEAYTAIDAFVSPYFK